MLPSHFICEPAITIRCSNATVVLFCGSPRCGCSGIQHNIQNCVCSWLWATFGAAADIGGVMSHTAKTQQVLRANAHALRCEHNPQVYVHKMRSRSICNARTHIILINLLLNSKHKTAPRCKRIITLSYTIKVVACDERTYSPIKMLIGTYYIKCNSTVLEHESMRSRVNGINCALCCWVTCFVVVVVVAVEPYYDTRMSGPALQWFTHVPRFRASFVSTQTQRGHSARMWLVI